MHSDSEQNELEPGARFSIWPQWREIKRRLSVNQDVVITDAGLLPVQNMQNGVNVVSHHAVRKITQ